MQYEVIDLKLDYKAMGVDNGGYQPTERYNTFKFKLPANLN